MKETKYITLDGKKYDVAQRHILVVKSTRANLQALLDFNDQNRPMSLPHVKMIKTMVQDGGWVFDGETVVITSDAHMVDGQHRCKSLFEMEYETDLIVVLGAHPDSGLTRGNNLPRYIHGTMAILGVKDSVTVTAIVGRVLRNGKSAGAMVRIPASTYMQFIQAHGHAIDEAKDFSKRVEHEGRIISRALAGALYFALSQRDKARTDRFLKFIMFGEEAGRSPAAHAVRNSLIANKSERERFRSETVWALIIKAWNFKDEPVKIVKFLKDEKWPEIQP